jgi:hypothetical protein
VRATFAPRGRRRPRPQSAPRSAARPRRSCRGAEPARPRRPARLGPGNLVGTSTRSRPAASSPDRGAGDRRHRLVSLTPSGRCLLARALRATAATDERILTALPASDRDRFYESARAGKAPVDAVRVAKRERDAQLRELTDQPHGANLDLGHALVHNLTTVDPTDMDVARFFVLCGRPHRTNYADWQAPWPRYEDARDQVDVVDMNAELRSCAATSPSGSASRSWSACDQRSHREVWSYARTPSFRALPAQAVRCPPTRGNSTTHGSSGAARACAIAR